MNSFLSAAEETHAIKCDLAVEVLRSSGRLRLRVTGSSMLPSVWPGDTLLIDRVSAEDISKGEIVLYGRDRRLFVHRVVKTAVNRDSTILTRGDAMPQTDPPVLSKQLLGKVSFIVRDGRLIEPRRNISFPQRAVAALARNLGIATRIVVGVHDKLSASAKHNSCDQAVSCQS